VTVVPWSPYALFRAVFNADGSAVLVDPVTGEVTAEASLADGVRQNSAGSQRAIAKGYQAGLVQDGGSVTFNPAYQSPPQVLMRGGINGGSSTYPVYRADALSASGFTCYAKNVTKGTITGQNAEFTSPVSTSTPGATVGPATLASAPAYDNGYTARFDLSLSLTVPGGGVGGGQIVAVVAIESNEGVSGWIERATRSYATHLTTAGSTTADYPDQEVVITDSSLGINDQIRLKLKSVTITAGSSGSATLTGYDNTTGHGHGVLYNTDSGGSVATKTPDADDFIFWEAFEVAT